MRLFHFSDDPDIQRFVPRPVTTPSPRRPGEAWLNGPLVWAIAETRDYLYLFPRDCPRILLWATPQTTTADRELWLGTRGGAVAAIIEQDWASRLARAEIHRYDLPPERFEDLNDAGMHVSRHPVIPNGVETLRDLPGHLAARGVELHTVEALTPLKTLWSTTLHVSRVRLRHARGWR